MKGESFSDYIFIIKILTSIFLDEVSIKNPSFVARGRLAIWKLLGTLLGLYSNRDSTTSLFTDDWLLKANSLLLKETSLDNFTRELCQFLGRNDFLAAPNALLLPDLILGSLLTRNHRYPSNIEIWLKRIDAAIGRL